jgi:hypothetical protein
MCVTANTQAVCVCVLFKVETLLRVSGVEGTCASSCLLIVSCSGSSRTLATVCGL